MANDWYDIKIVGERYQCARIARQFYGAYTERKYRTRDRRMYPTGQVVFRGGGGSANPDYAATNLLRGRRICAGRNRRSKRPLLLPQTSLFAKADLHRDVAKDDWRFAGETKISDELLNGRVIVSWIRSQP
jgi:hypothetical protein